MEFRGQQVPLKLLKSTHPYPRREGLVLVSETEATRQIALPGP